MHIFKSRNPIWLILDLVCAWGFWKVPVLIPAIFFTFDSLLQLVYMFFPEMIDTLEKKNSFRIFYTLALLVAIVFIIKALANRGLI